MTGVFPQYKQSWINSFRFGDNMNNLPILKPISWSSSKRQVLQISISLFLSIMIGLVDFLTGPDFTFSPFYLIPPMFTAWKMSGRFALFISFVTSITWLWVDFSSKRYSLVTPVYTWNFFSRLILLLVVVFLLSSLKKSMEREKSLSSTDHLTKAVNSRVFKELLDLEIKRSIRYHHSLTLAYVDIDNFKLINDWYGHAVGDKVLATISNEIRLSIRQNDNLGRLGGDEFAMLLVETDSAAARNVVTNIQARLTTVIRENNWPISCSFGVLSCTDSFCTPEEMINLADQLMYSVKKSTKNSANFATFSNFRDQL
jgi:diguanylate cyclase (GGDEF)-like protein